MIRDRSFIKAARGYLDWTLDDLANQSDLSKKAVHAIESGTMPLNRAKASTLLAIETAFNRRNIFFSESGARIKRHSITQLNGKGQWFLDALDDVIATMKMTPFEEREIITWNASDELSPEPVIQRYKQLIQMGVRIRQFLKEGDTYWMGKQKDYRWVNEEHFTQNTLTMVYGNKIAVSVASGEGGLIIHSVDLANAEKKKLDKIWSTCKAPSGNSTARTRF